MSVVREKPTVLEVCAGGGGQALGLQRAGFETAALVEIDPWASRTLASNLPDAWIIEGDLKELDGRDFAGVDLLAGGVPCPPFSIAGQQLGERDERDLVPELVRLASVARPRAVLLENVPGLMQQRFSQYRARLSRQLVALGYIPQWTVLNACDFRVPQLRPRTILVALSEHDAQFFNWPNPSQIPPPTVGKALFSLMGAQGWEGAESWASRANAIAPTLVGGSRKHGGPDLGPTRSKRAWEELGVDGRGIADAPPGPGFEGMPRLTLEMAARIQGFPSTWTFQGGKTAAYRQIGNALPPPVARAVGKSLIKAWKQEVPREGQQTLAV